jgi:hypothetical protein
LFHIHVQVRRRRDPIGWLVLPCPRCRCPQAFRRLREIEETFVSSFRTDQTPKGELAECDFCTMVLQLPQDAATTIPLVCDWRLEDGLAPLRNRTNPGLLLPEHEHHHSDDELTALLWGAATLPDAADGASGIRAYLVFFAGAVPGAMAGMLLNSWNCGLPNPIFTPMLTFLAGGVVGSVIWNGLTTQRQLLLFLADSVLRHGLDARRLLALCHGHPARRRLLFALERVARLKRPQGRR